MSSRSPVDRIEAQSRAANLVRELQAHRAWAEKQLASDDVDWRHVVRDDEMIVIPSEILNKPGLGIGQSRDVHKRVVTKGEEMPEFDEREPRDERRTLLIAIAAAADQALNSRRLHNRTCRAITAERQRLRCLASWTNRSGGTTTNVEKGQATEQAVRDAVEAVHTYSITPVMQKLRYLRASRKTVQNILTKIRKEK